MAEVSGPTPVSLILRLRRGRAEDWQVFHAIYGPLIYRIARSCRLHEHDAEEVTAIVMSQLTPRLLKGFKVDHRRGRFRGYIARTTRRAAAQYRTGMSSRTLGIVDAGELERGSAELPPDEELLRWERCERLRLALGLLEQKCGPKSRNIRAFKHYVIDAEPAKAVASRYSITCQRLYEIKRELLAQLERILKQLDEELGEV